MRKIEKNINNHQIINHMGKIIFESNSVNIQSMNKRIDELVKSQLWKLLKFPKRSDKFIEN